jgi:hypothetical protein
MKESRGETHVDVGVPAPTTNFTDLEVTLSDTRR